MDSQAQKILLVDDEPALLKMMAVYLTRKGHSVTTADSTDRAWDAVESSTGAIAAAVLDASMRGLSTEDLALRLLAASPSVCVIVASGYPVDMDRLDAAGPGRVRFLQKPFTAETLDATLRRMIGSHEVRV
jgi:DNA-binding NtrC family response regulator